MVEIILTRSDKKDKKWKVIIETEDRKKTINFGQKGA